MSRPVSAFAQEAEKGYPYRYRAHAYVEVLAGGIPTNPDVAEGWLKAKGYEGALKDELLRQQVAEVMAERGLTADQVDEAVAEVSKNRHLNGFKRVPTTDEVSGNPDLAEDVGYPEHAGELYIEGRQLKACLKEAASVAADAGKMKPRGLGTNNSRKGIISFMAEHVFVIERRLYLGVTKATDIIQGFVHTYHGDAISMTEVLEGAEFDFTVETDHEFSDHEWAMIWLTAQNQGIGANRSQSYGRFTVTEWERVGRRSGKPARRSVRAVAKAA